MLHSHLSYCKLASILSHYIFNNFNHSYLQLFSFIHLPQSPLFRSYPQYLLQISQHCLNISTYLLSSSSTITCCNLTFNTLFRIIFLVEYMKLQSVSMSLEKIFLSLNSLESSQRNLVSMSIH